MNSKPVLSIVLSIFIVYGSICGLLYSVDQDLNSDTVVPGLVAMEIFRHGSLQYSFPNNDPYLFTDIYPFYIIPQVLSGYDPVVLKLTAYVMFLLVVMIFSYMVYMNSGMTNALIFAALLVNISPIAYTKFITPEYHIGTIIAAGVFILLFDFQKIKRANVYTIVAFIIATCLIVISDSIIMATFVIPYVIAYVLFYRKKYDSRDKTIASLLGFSVLTLLLKTYVIPKIDLNLLPHLVYCTTPVAKIDTMLTFNLPLYVKGITLLLSQSTFSILENNINIIDILIALVFLTVLYVSLKTALANIRWKNVDKKVKTDMTTGYLYSIFIVSAIVMFLCFVCTGLCTDLGSSRFLTFTAVTIFAMIAMAYKENNSDKKNMLFLGLVIVLIASTVPLNYSSVSGLDFKPNAEHYELISYLKENNITYSGAGY